MIRQVMADREFSMAHRAYEWRDRAIGCRVQNLIAVSAAAPPAAAIAAQVMEWPCATGPLGGLGHRACTHASDMLCR
jgi:hypothetical protein